MSFKSARSDLTERRDVIQETADLIIEASEKGVKPWVRPWNRDKCAGPQAPINSENITIAVELTYRSGVSAELECGTALFRSLLPVPERPPSPINTGFIRYLQTS